MMSTKSTNKQKKFVLITKERNRLISVIKAVLMISIRTFILYSTTVTDSLHCIQFNFLWSFQNYCYRTVENRYLYFICIKMLQTSTNVQVFYFLF